MAFIVISFQSRRVLVAQPQSLADLLRTAKEIFKPTSDDVHLSIEFTNSTGNKAMVELHESSYSILKDGDATFLTVTSKKDNEPLGAALALLSLQDKSEAKKKLEEDVSATRELALQMAIESRRRFIAKNGKKAAAILGLLPPEEKQEENTRSIEKTFHLCGRTGAWIPMN